MRASKTFRCYCWFFPFILSVSVIQFPKSKYKNNNGRSIIYHILSLSFRISSVPILIVFTLFCFESVHSVCVCVFVGDSERNEVENKEWASSAQF